jgi:hypothetical protein
LKSLRKCFNGQYYAFTNQRNPSELSAPLHFSSELCSLQLLLNLRHDLIEQEDIA